jgi:hypothetical protein
MNSSTRPLPLIQGRGDVRLIKLLLLQIGATILAIDPACQQPFEL